MRNGIAIHKFTIESNDNVSAGIVLDAFSRWENYNPTFGAGLGHDIIEHDLKNETGAFDEELAAHGAVLFTTEFLSAIPYPTWGTPALNLASGMASFQFQESTVDHIRTPPKARGVDRYEVRQLKEFAFEYIQAMIKEWKNERSNCYDCDETEGNGECVCVNPFEGKDAFRRIYGWLKFGYARAKRKYKDRPCLAFALKNEIDEVTKRESAALAEYVDSGVEFKMRLDLENCEVKIIYPRETREYWERY